MELKAGSRWRSAACDTEVVVVKSPGGELDLGCGGHPLVPIDEEAPGSLALAEGLADGSPVGKRFTDDDETIELLVTKAGEGSLHLGDQKLHLKGAKPLPSSD